MKRVNVGIFLVLANFLGFSSQSNFGHAHVWEEILEVAKRTDESAGRCVKGRNIPDETCKGQQDAMIALGCVKPEHVSFIRDNGVYPLCDFRQEPASACFCGCFAKGTRVLGRNNETKQQEWILIEILVERPNDYEIATMSSDSSLSSMSIAWVSVKRVTRGPEANPLVVITTDDGSSISLSEEHAVLLASGKMIEAQQLRVGDELLNLAGMRTKIVIIDRKPADGDVYNVITSGESANEHVIIAEYLFMGDLRWQSFLPMDENEFAIHP